MNTLIEKDLLDGIWKEDGLYVQDNDGSEDKLFSWDEIGQTGEEVLEAYLILKEEFKETAIQSSLQTFYASIIVVRALQGEEKSKEKLKEFAYNFEKKRVEFYQENEPFIGMFYSTMTKLPDSTLNALGYFGLNMMILNDIEKNGEKSILKNLITTIIGKMVPLSYVGELMTEEFAEEKSNDIIDNYNNPEIFLKTLTEMSLSFTDYLSEIPSSLEYIAGFAGESFNNLLSELRDEFHQAEAKKSPLILDLDGNGVKTTSLENSVNFDHDNNGFAEETAWVGQGDGLLVRDINGNGTIDSGTELFGNNTLLKDGTKASNGFTALSDLDENNDGKIDSNDEIFNELKNWKDLNNDGVTDSGELFSLSDVNISSISTAYNNTTTIDEQGNAHKQTGTYEKNDGTTVSVDDVWLNVDTMNTTPKELLEETEEISQLPDMKGFGNVYSLHQTMLRDESNLLQSLIEEFANETDINKKQQLVTDIIYSWTGVTDIDPESRASSRIYGNAIGDARKLEALEEFLGEEYVGIWCWDEKDPNPHGQATPYLLETFDKLSTFVYNQLIAQTDLKDLYSKINYTWVDNKITLDLSDVSSELLNLISSDESTGKILLGKFVDSITDLGVIDSTNFKVFKETFISMGDEYRPLVESNGIFGSDSDDDITKTDKGHSIWGFDGNDKITTGNYADTVYGGKGNDSANTGSGNDVISGGKGTDFLQGGQGDDTYIFNRGDGTDTVYDSYFAKGHSANTNSGYKAGNDTLKFGEGITQDDIIIQKEGNNIIISIRDGETPFAELKDKIVIENGSFNSMKIEKFEFSDGTIISSNSLPYATLGTMEADTIVGTNTADYIVAQQGDDIINSGQGNDIILGGEGSDTYIYNKEDGQDTIYDYDGLKDLLKIEDLTVGDLLFKEDKEDLIIGVKENQTIFEKLKNKINIKNWFAADKDRIENIELSEGITLNKSDIIEKTETDIHIIKQYQLLVQEMSAIEDEKGIGESSNIKEEEIVLDMLAGVAE